MLWASGSNVDGIPTNTNPADVINMSLEVWPSPVMQDAINQANEAGTIVVVAAGNSSDDARITLLLDLRVSLL
ncbi:MAG: S8 family serine peptidase [Deinococcales bacterium]